jgi:hypothetical protein
MARVTAEQVLAIIDTDADVDAAIETANLVVTEELGDAGLSDDRLTAIEKYLAAHLITVTDPREAQVGLGASSFRFDGQTGMNLDGSRFGQTVKFLDSSGILAGLGKQRATLELL